MVEPMEQGKTIDAAQHGDAQPAKVAGAAQKVRRVSLARKRASLSGKFPVSEPGRDINEAN
jgi:hypothetical protein